MKRSFDLLASALLVVFGLPLWLLLAAAVKLDSRGPVFYVDRRVGVGEREFGMLKFRTMVEDAAEQQTQLERENEAGGALFKIRDDPRLTRVGRVLRRFSLDEMPQLINVLRGQMSLVGPRPLPLRDYRLLEDWHRARYLVLPGMTGLWQISGRSGLSFDDLVRLDFTYLENWSIWLDIAIIAKTIPAVDLRPGRVLSRSPAGADELPPYNRAVQAPKILAVASAVDLDFRYGCTPAWWQLWKGMYEAGVDLVVTPYRGRPVESPWWRTAPNPTYREGESYAAVRDGLARLKGDRYLRRGEDSPAESAFDRLTRETIWRVVTPRWRRHLERLVERERPDAVVFFTVPMAHFRGIPTALRERFGIPVVFYDGDVPMSLPEFGGMDTGFNYYHGADPSEYDLVLSNSEGGLPRLLELGARRAEAVFWGADPEFFAPQPVAKEMDVFFYGYGDKFRQEWTAAMIGEPSRADPGIDFALGGRDFRGDTGTRTHDRRRPVQRLRPRDLVGARQPQRHPALARHRAARRRPAVRSSSPRPVPPSSRTRTPGSSTGSSPAARSSSSRTPSRRSPPTGCCSTIRRRPRRWVPAPASACSTSTPTPTVPAACSTSSSSARWRA